jgi:predicted dehydrogenase
VSAPLGVALVGAGEIGALRAAAVSLAPSLRLAAVADLRADAATALASRHRAEASGDWRRSVLREDVSFVIVSTPPSSHAEIALAALEAGKHVLVEKPLAHTCEDGEAICAAAEARSLLVKTGFNHRHFRSMAFARRLLDSGRIGDVRSVQAYAGHPGGAEFGHAWVHDASVTGGGALVDNGIHVLDLVRFLGGDFESASGIAASHLWPFAPAEDNAFALFRAADGRVASVHASWTEWRGYRFHVEVTGTRGFVRASYPPMLAEWGAAAEPGLRARRRVELFPRFQVTERLRGWRSTIVASFVEEMEAFAGGIREGREVPASGRDGLRALRMARAVYASSREGREVRF